MNIHIGRVLLNERSKTLFEYRKNGIYLIFRGVEINLTEHYEIDSDVVLDHLYELSSEDIGYKNRVTLEEVIEDLKDNHF